MGFSGKSAGVGCHFFLQGIFPTQGLNPGLPHCRQTRSHLSHQGSPPVVVADLKQMGIPDHLTCLLGNLYAGQEETVRTRHGPTDWFKIGKGAHQGCLFNLYAEYIMQNARLDEAQAGIKIAGGNINNLRYADDTTLMEKVKKN